MINEPKANALTTPPLCPYTNHMFYTSSMTYHAVKISLFCLKYEQYYSVDLHKSYWVTYHSSVLTFERNAFSLNSCKIMHKLLHIHTLLHLLNTCICVHIVNSSFMYTLLTALLCTVICRFTYSNIMFYNS